MDQDDDPALAETHSPALAQRPVPDARARDVARASIANALFATKQQVKLGRYHLLERLGAGGMGVVWGAFDPELERRVAIKLVQAKASASRERILLEGQALAKLSHPNVVTVHDVGVVDDEVYLVMEWIRGRNLRVHCAQPRTVREIVALYRAAGDGLLAAHRAGLVHRDFKPENVMVGDDGRVRVLDFGLALDRDEGDDHVIAGTPKYMAPEQQRGDETTERADQYAFGIALREALAGRNADKRDASVPGWLAAVADRATAAQPSERFPTMAELLRALARDPATVWRRRIVVAAVVGIVGAAFAVGSLRAGDGRIAPCTGATDELARAWNPDRRARMLDHARQLGPYGADEATRLDARLTSYGERWIAAHRGACLAHRRGELTARLYERGLACLARARVALETVIEVVSRAPIERFPEALVAARGLPAVDRCTLDDATASPSSAIAPRADELSNQIARASMLALAADPQALDVALAAVREADELQFPPLIARAQLVLGRALMGDQSRLPDAIRAFERSSAAALDAGDDSTFVESFARSLFAYSRTPKELVPAELASLPASLRYVQQIARRTREAGAFARALLYNNAGTERFTAGDVVAARRWYREAYAEIRAGAGDIELASALGNLASTVESRDERDRLFAELRGHLERELGPHHAFTLNERLRAAMFTEHATRAADQLRDLCATLRTWHPHRKDKIDQCYYELGWLADERGDRTEARTAMASVGGSSDDRVGLARAFSTMYGGDHASAARVAGELAAAAAQRPAWWQQFHAADAWLVEAMARITLGERARAASVLERTLALLDHPSLNRTATFYQRRLARVRALLATVADNKRAREVAAQALDWYRAAGGYDAAVARLESIISGSR